MLFKLKTVAFNFGLQTKEKNWRTWANFIKTNFPIIQDSLCQKMLGNFFILSPEVELRKPDNKLYQLVIGKSLLFM